MRLEHSFRVPAPVPEVWTAVVDPERVAPCLPGATLTSVDGDAFTGTVKVKLGPISLTYKGKGEFLTRDEDARRVVIKASGKDAAGGGTAAATVTLTLAADGDATVGTVETDLSITGKPAQFGRGLIAEVGGKLLDTFATCLSGKLAPGGGLPAPRTPAANGSAAEPTTTPANGTAASPTATTPPATAQAVPDPPEPRSSPTPSDAPAASEAPDPPGAPAASEASTPSGADPHRALPPGRPHLAAVPETEAEPIDLMELAGRSVAKRALPVAAVLAAVGAVIAIVLRRKR